MFLDQKSNVASKAMQTPTVKITTAPDGRNTSFQTFANAQRRGIFGNAQMR